MSMCVCVCVTTIQWVGKQNYFYSTLSVHLCSIFSFCQKEAIHTRPVGTADDKNWPLPSPPQPYAACQWRRNPALGILPSGPLTPRPACVSPTSRATARPTPTSSTARLNVMSSAAWPKTVISGQRKKTENNLIFMQKTNKLKLSVSPHLQMQNWSRTERLGTIVCLVERTNQSAGILCECFKIKCWWIISGGVFLFC